MPSLLCFRFAGVSADNCPANVLPRSSPLLDQYQLVGNEEDVWLQLFSVSEVCLTYVYESREVDFFLWLRFTKTLIEESKKTHILVCGLCPFCSLST